jgi:hypothetical protein
MFVSSKYRIDESILINRKVNLVCVPDCPASTGTKKSNAPLRAKEYIKFVGEYGGNWFGRSIYFCTWNGRYLKFSEIRKRVLSTESY